MLAHQRLGARAFAAEDRLNDMLMVMVRPQPLLARVDSLEEVRARVEPAVEDSRKEAHLPHDRVKVTIVRRLDNGEMEVAVERSPCLLLLIAPMRGGEDAVAKFEQIGETFSLDFGQSILGYHPAGEPFQRP